MPTYKVTHNRHRPTTEEMDADDLDDLRGWIHELGLDWEMEVLAVEEVDDEPDKSHPL